MNEAEDPETLLYAALTAAIAEMLVIKFNRKDGRSGDLISHDFYSNFECACDVLHSLGLIHLVLPDGSLFAPTAKSRKACFFKLNHDVADIGQALKSNLPANAPTLARMLAVFIGCGCFYGKITCGVASIDEPFEPELKPELVDLLVEVGFLRPAGRQFAWTEMSRLSLSGPYPDAYRQKLN